MPLTHVLFDLDNTLYASSSGIMQYFDGRITEYVQQILKLDFAAAQEARHDFYATYGTTLRGLQQHYGDKVDVEEYLRFVHEMDMAAYLKLDEELDRQLGAIKSRKIIFTNSPVEHAERVLAALGIEQHFEQIFDIRYHTFEPKPSPATYERVLAALGVSGDATVFLEDTPQNLVPARVLGMTTILISDVAIDDAAQQIADYVVPDIFAALTVVRELEGTH